MRPAQSTVRQSNLFDPIERRHDHDDVPDPLRSATSRGCVDVRSVMHRSGCANPRRHGPWNCDESPPAGCVSLREHAGAYSRSQHLRRLAHLHQHSFARTHRGEPSGAAHCVLSVNQRSRRARFGEVATTIGMDVFGNGNASNCSDRATRSRLDLTPLGNLRRTSLIVHLIAQSEV